MKLLLEQWREYISEEGDPCWDGYKQVGMKDKDGKEVPNCVPIEEDLEKIVREEFNAVLDEGDFFANMRAKQKRCKGKPKTGDCAEDRPTEKQWKDIIDEDEKKACKPSKGKRSAKRVDGKCRSYGQAGKAKDGGDRIRPGTKKGDAYCARSAKIKKCKNPPCANALSRKKWKCQGDKSVA